MEQSKIDRLNLIIKNYNQYELSDLHIDIEYILNCGIEESKRLAKSHCNMVSFWALNVASGYTEIEYRDFFKSCLKKEYCEINGNINVMKDVICKNIFKREFEIIQYKEFEDIENPLRLNPDKFYQMRIVDGSHFMSCYIQDNILKISDTSNRGIAVPAIGASRVDEKHFSWILEI